MHGTSHHIGLDTHDYGLLHEPMQPNMVFTVEPGIYLPEEGFGIRLEDDVVIQKSGEPFNLMKNIPIEADEIEVIVPAKKGLEYKIYALKYGKIKYDWITDKGIVYTDFHGEFIDDKNGFYESYLHAYSNNMAGTVTLPFGGKHGWYFRNGTNEDITITINLKGQYRLFNK